MLTVSDLDAWLHAAVVDGGLGLDATIPVLPGSLIDMKGYPDKALFVTSTPGGGLQLEGATDLQNFQFRFRGAQAAPDAAYFDCESFARDVDLKLVHAQYPTTIGGLVVTRLYRTGGPPSYLASAQRRAHFTCGYLFEAAVPALP